MDPADIVFSDARTASALSRAVRAGKARRLAHGVYSFDLRTAPGTLTRRHWMQILAHFCPGALIADRSARAARPDDDGHLFVVNTRPRPLELPGLIIVPRPGEAPQADDVPLPNGIWLSSRPRALLENLRPARAVKGRPRRTLSERELHEWVVQLRRTDGPEKLNQYRDRARELAPQLGLAELFPRLDELIGAVLGTKQVETSVPALAAAQRGHPFDERRERVLEALASFLDQRAPSLRPAFAVDAPRRKYLAFYEAYFSNFIEGTEFTVEEAADIALNGVIPAARPADAHDILGTYLVVSDETEMRRRPSSVDELFTLLQRRHARILEGRPEKRPGLFKERANRAGSSEFVAPELVQGTLAMGFGMLDRLADPFARAVFMMFLVAEVHPFDDGNGRVARVMMNAEFEGAGEQRIIIPTVFRTEYLSALRALTHHAQPSALTRVLDFAQRYTAQIDFASLEGARAQLTQTNAFVDPTEATERGIRLMLPSSAV